MSVEERITDRAGTIAAIIGGENWKEPKVGLWLRDVLRSFARDAVLEAVRDGSVKVVPHSERVVRS